MLFIPNKASAPQDSSKKQLLLSEIKGDQHCAVDQNNITSTPAFSENQSKEDFG